MTALGPVRPLRLATRRSALALAQSRAVGERLAALTGRPLELVEVTTRGDTDPAPLATIGGTGVFVAAVRQAVVDGSADCAVHSLKDLPTAADPRLSLAAIPERADPRDALVSRDGRGLAELPAGARVGTGSPRRRAQLLARRPDLDVRDIRGNVDTRIARVDGDPGGATAPDLDAVVLASAGLARLGRADRISHHLEPDVMVPAPGQGALAVEVRADLVEVDPQAGPALADALARIDDPATRSEVTAERTLLAALDAGCSAPVGALAHVAAAGTAAATLHLRAVMATPDGSLVHGTDSGPIDQAEKVGRRLAAQLLARVTATAAPRSTSTRSASTTSTRSTSTTGTTPTRPTTHRGSPPR